MKVAAGRDVGQTIGFCRLSSGPRSTLVKDDRPQKTMVCPTFGWSQGDFRECSHCLRHNNSDENKGPVQGRILCFRGCGRLPIGLLTVRWIPLMF